MLLKSNMFILNYSLKGKSYRSAIPPGSVEFCWYLFKLG